MASSLNLLPGPARHGDRRRSRAKRRVILAILLISGIVGAGAVVELLAGPKVKHTRIE
jgi:hypothetical protein